MNISEREKIFKEELAKSYEYWKQKYIVATENSRKKALTNKGVLIEVATQHPLINGETPGKEFCLRLDKAIELYKYYTSQGLTVNLCVFGSLHLYNGVADKVSLSAAGQKYLLERGIPNDDIFAEETIKKYKSKDGVYNGADECYVVSKLFDNGDYAKLITVCSVNQSLRKMLSYIEFGYITQCYTVVCDNMFHSNIVDEVFCSANHMLYFDHSWQSSASEAFIDSRKLRKP